VESGAGEAALLPDDLYSEAGATVGDAWAADVVVKVAPPSTAEVGTLRSSSERSSSSTSFGASAPPTSVAAT
jgi:NAD/NADP transhydrogenase alpha subunit